jgi:hypothetical protein
MDLYDPADDDKYTVGIAASLCLVSLPVIYLGTRPVLSILHTPWTPWFVASLFLFVPILMAFITLYCHAWHPQWSQPKRVFLYVLLSCVIFGADLLFICCLVALCSMYVNCLLHGG